MQTIHIKVEDKYLDFFLTLVNSLKDNIVKEVEIESDKIDKEYLLDLEKRLEKGEVDLKRVTSDELFEELGI